MYIIYEYNKVFRNRSFSLRFFLSFLYFIANKNTNLNWIFMETVYSIVFRKNFSFILHLLLSIPHYTALCVQNVCFFLFASLPKLLLSTIGFSPFLLGFFSYFSIKFIFMNNSLIKQSYFML